MKILYIDLTRLFWVYTIILISNIGNLHVYSERTVIRNTRVHGITYRPKLMFDRRSVQLGVARTYLVDFRNFLF